MSRFDSHSLRPSDAHLTLAASEPHVNAIGTWHNLVIIVWWSAATAPAVEQLEQITASMRETHPERVSHIHLVKNRAGFPTQPARAAFIRIMRDHAPGIANCAVVVGGSGFWASTMRSAITSMRVLSPRNFEMRLHGASPEILEWLPQAHEAQTGVRLLPASLEQLLKQAERWIDHGGALEV